MDAVQEIRESVAYVRRHFSIPDRPSLRSLAEECCNILCWWFHAVRKLERQYFADGIMDRSVLEEILQLYSLWLDEAKSALNSASDSFQIDGVDHGIQLRECVEEAQEILERHRIAGAGEARLEEYFQQNPW